MNNYPVGDFLIRFKNASLARHKQLEVNSNKKIKAVADVLEKEGYITEVKEEKGKIFLKIVYRKKEPILTQIKLVSKPGIRIYKSADELGKVKGPSKFIVSTPKGVMSSSDAIKKRLGGEVIAEIL